jgi:hypothetical protein
MDLSKPRGKTVPQRAFWIVLKAAFLICAIVGWPIDEAAAAARSVHVIIKNNSNHALIDAHWELSHGIVTRKPLGRIDPGGIGEMFAESNGFATGTEGFVRYHVEGVSGDAQFNWDNPFVGNNSASGSGPPGYAVQLIGDKGNRTLAFYSFHDANAPVALCNADWVILNLGQHVEDKLDALDVGPGFLTTPLKRLGFGGWVDTGCRAQAEGWVVRNAQWSTDKFYTIDLNLHSFIIEDKQLRIQPPSQRFVRLEVEPGTPAHNSANVRTNQYIRVEGIVLIDTHFGEELIEIHPRDPIVAVTAPKPFGPDTCKQGFVWREAIPNDHVCVVPSERDQARIDNAQSGQRRQPGGGASGPDTCRQGFVWREATPADHVCVTPETRARVTNDNQHVGERRL